MILLQYAFHSYFLHMCLLSECSLNVPTLEFYEEGKIYVVVVGYIPGIYDFWKEAKKQVDDGFPHVSHKSFKNREEAEKAFAAYWDLNVDMEQAASSNTRSSNSSSSFKARHKSFKSREEAEKAFAADWDLNVDMEQAASSSPRSSNSSSSFKAYEGLEKRYLELQLQVALDERDRACEERDRACEERDRARRVS